jgi:peptidyl-dipeptidase Dcp
MNRDDLATNPLMHEWNTPYGLPPFSEIRAEHFVPAFEVAMPAHLAELDAIAHHAAAPTFANTAFAFDASGRRAQRLEYLLSNLASSETSPALQAVERTMAPLLAAHENAIYMNSALFARIDALFDARASLGLEAEEQRLLERIHLDFVRAGAKLHSDKRARYAEVTQELASLYASFGQNVLADEATYALELKDAADWAGLPESLCAALRTAAAERGLAEGAHVVTLSPSIAEPFLTFSTRRDLRHAIWAARIARGAHAGAHDNRPVAARIVALRQEQAQLLGYATYADYELADRMAPDTHAVADLLMQAWVPAKQKAADDRQMLVDMAQSLGEPTDVAAWDWRYLAEKVRQQRYALDDAAIKPYFSLDNMIAAMLDCAHRLFGIRFVEQQGTALHHPDARLWEVRNHADALIGIFIGDNFARTSKRSGAWMSVFRSQSAHNGGTLPIVINNNNFAKASPCLLSFEDVRTLFHEFGHGLHGLLSQARFDRLSGTRVLRDYVELPSQLFENWAEDEGVLKRHARHWQTGEPIPSELLEKLKLARQFNQAWATVMYVGPALIDMALHALPPGTEVDLTAFEEAQRAAIGVPQDIGLRHHLSHFQHLFAGSGYAAGYYVYMWAEVLEADGFDAFTEAGDPFDVATAQRLLKHVYSAGNTVEPAKGFHAFRGRAARVEPMLRKRGLL